MSDLPPVPPGALPGGAQPADYPAVPPLGPPLSPVPPGTVRPGAAWPVPPEEPGPTGGGRRRAWVVAVAVLAAIALVAAVALVAGGGDDDPDRATDPFDRTPTTAADAPDPTTPPPAPPADLEAVIEEIKVFVERERGLPFLRDVTVELADDEEFEARLLEDFEEDVEEIVTQGQILEALGLVEPGTDLVEALRTLLGAGVVGFYDPATDELVVRGTSTSPYVRSVIAHELTHALDDQHFELERPDLDDATDESGFGFSALVEGNAVRIEDAYLASLSADEQQEAVAEELTIGAGVDLFSIPPVLFELLAAPYLLGPLLVDATIDDGGQERLDAAFTQPPTTSEHVLQPDRYLDGDGPVAVATPTADGDAVDEGVIGALGLAIVLGVSPLGLPGFGDPDPAVDGWGGDRYVAWDDLDGRGTCLRAAIVGDTPEDTAELADALREWADDAPTTTGVDATVEGGADGTPVTLTSCS
jgi:hypothetical protein